MIEFFLNLSFYNIRNFVDIFAIVMIKKHLNAKNIFDVFLLIRFLISICFKAPKRLGIATLFEPKSFVSC